MLSTHQVPQVILYCWPLCCHSCRPRPEVQVTCSYKPWFVAHLFLLLSFSPPSLSFSTLGRARGHVMRHPSIPMKRPMEGGTWDLEPITSKKLRPANNSVSNILENEISELGFLMLNRKLFLYLKCGSSVPVKPSDNCRQADIFTADWETLKHNHVCAKQQLDSHQHKVWDNKRLFCSIEF